MAKQFKRVKFIVGHSSIPEDLTCVDEHCSVNSMYDIMYYIRYLSKEFKKRFDKEPNTFVYVILGD